MRYHFEDFVLDKSRHELLHRGVARPVAPQVIDLLAHLIDHRDRVVSKEELIVAVWNGRAVSDAALTTRVNVLRNTLHDDGRAQRLIRTHPRKGFRFIGEVRAEGWPASLPALTSNGAPSIAVLPFANLSGDPAQDFVGDVLADEVLTELARLRWLLVIARNSSFTYKGSAVDIRKIGSQLGVGYVLEGGARHRDGRVRVTCRLIDASTALQVWSARYDRNAFDVHQVLDEIAEAVVTETAPAILEAERNRIARLSLDDLTAWEAFQRGVARMLTHSADGTDSARRFFEKAVSLRPDYSSGFDGLAWSHLVDASAFGRMPVEEACRLGEPLVRKALELDPDNASARARLSLILHLRGDNQAAIEETDAALINSPNCADACGARGAALVFSGRPAEGRAAIERFLRLSPRDPARPIRLSQLAASYYFEKNYENAVHAGRQTIRDYPAVPMAYRWLAASLGQLGCVAEGAHIVDVMQRRHASSIAAYVTHPPPYFRPDDHEHLLEGLAKAGCRM